MPVDLTEWPSDAAEGYRAAGYWTGATYPEFLAELVQRHGERTAVLDDRMRLSFRELDEQSAAVARGLHALGIRAGERILVQLPNRAEFLVLWFALVRIGAVPVHTQPGHRRSEITHLAELSGASGYVIPDRHDRFDHRRLAAEVRAECPALRHVIVLGDPGGEPGFIAFSELAGLGAGTVLPERAANAGEIAVLLLSGGTTGKPKLIPRTHDDYRYNGVAAAAVCELGEDSVYLATLPISFNYTWNCPGVLGTLGAGGTVVLAGNPDPGYCFELIERHRVTITAINPQLAPVWLDEVEHTSADLSSLRVLQIGSARLADDTARQVIERFEPAVLQQVFGMAEGLLNLTRLGDDRETLATTQGKPISVADEIRVVDPEDNEVAAGEPGELLTRGPYTLRGYYRAEEHNAKNFTPDGFYRTGDLVRRTESGHLIVVGRVKDQINRGGEKIAATEVEGHLLAHPGIRSVALVGAPDTDLGERSVAFVVAQHGDAPNRLELTKFLEQRGIAAYKAPDRVEHIETMPLTPLGKMDKKALAERLA
ncbi:(2,3-dihydroxybenzoyl)adenylate synthase [Sciscionella marina]|uniref:(2,3-dihydroxybenzoyl)adenylate synthase n=1 Tax=Sciscionella marina TaxID=508770 RepID=UPI00037B0FBA|nr:AMP-binding protein [Sciscionella marina]